MYPRVNYEMTEEDLKALLEACRPTIAISVGGIPPSSPQENANRAWESLGKKMGFDHMTVQPIEGKDQRFFSAIPSETEEQKKARLVAEKIAALKSEKKKLLAEKQAIDKRLSEIEAGGCDE